MARWARDDWLDAIWDDTTLGPHERVVAYTFARFAGRNDTAWATWPELARRTGSSRATVWRAVRALQAGGWLREIEQRRQHYSPRYRLMIPQRSHTETSDEHQRSHAETSEQPPEVSHRNPEVSHRNPEVSHRDLSSQRSSQRDQSDARAHVPDPAAVRTALETATGRKITDEHARAVIRDILNRNGNGTIANPTAYIVKAITTEPERYRPASHPPRWCVYCQRREAVGRTNRCAECLAEENR